MFYGVIKTISARGFGFIGQNGGPDVYFHASILPDEEFARLRPEQPVMFELAKRDPAVKPAERKGPRAAKVKLIARMPGGILADKELTPPAHSKSRFRKATWKRRIDVRQLPSDDRTPGSDAP